MSVRIGIVGIGHLAGYIIEGLFRDGATPPVVISPRNREKASALAARFPLIVAEDSQGVVDAADVVILSVPPKVTTRTAEALRFRAGQVVVCVAAAVALADIAAACEPATSVRAMPMTAVALGVSPIPMYPGNERAAEALAPLGAMHVFASEQEFETATVMAMHYGWVMGVVAEAADWLIRQGMDSARAYALAADSTRAAASIALDRGATLPVEVADITREGNYTGLGWRVLGEHGVPAAWQEACERVFEASCKPKP